MTVKVGYCYMLSIIVAGLFTHTQIYKYNVKLQKRTKKNRSLRFLYCQNFHNRRKEYIIFFLSFIVPILFSSFLKSFPLRVNLNFLFNCKFNLNFFPRFYFWFETEKKNISLNKKAPPITFFCSCPIYSNFFFHLFFFKLLKKTSRSSTTTTTTKKNYRVPEINNNNKKRICHSF